MRRHYPLHAGGASAARDGEADLYSEALGAGPARYTLPGIAIWLALSLVIALAAVHHIYAVVQ